MASVAASRPRAGRRSQRCAIATSRSSGRARSSRTSAPGSRRSRSRTSSTRRPTAPRGSGSPGFCQFIPGVLMGPWSGAIADRFDRRRVLITTQTALAFCALGLWVMWEAGVRSPGALVAVVFATGVISALNIPSWQAFVSELVPKEDLLNAVTLNSAQFNAARAIGPALGGLVLATLGPSWAFLLNAISYIAVIGALWLVRVPVRHAVRTGQHVLEGLRRRVPLRAQPPRHPHLHRARLRRRVPREPDAAARRGVRRRACSAREPPGSVCSPPRSASEPSWRRRSSRRSTMSSAAARLVGRLVHVARLERDRVRPVDRALAGRARDVRDRHGLPRAHRHARTRRCS